MKFKLLFAAFGAAAFLVACGGSDDFSQPPATSSVPASASQSTDGFIAYLQKLVASPADNLEPVNTAMVAAPPADETGLPKLVD